MPVETLTKTPAIREPDRRPLWQALTRGAACRCPNCGKGQLFQGLLKVRPACGKCGEELIHHRADDFPPYVTMVLVGHVIVFAMLHLEMTVGPDPLIYLWFVPAAVVLALALLRPVKGAIVALQWALRMHGFGDDPD